MDEIERDFAIMCPALYNYYGGWNFTPKRQPASKLDGGYTNCYLCKIPLPKDEGSNYSSQNRCKAHVGKTYKDIVYDHYGRICGCCGETNIKLLTIDHADLSGSFERKHGMASYKKIVERGYPKHLRTYCMGCNWGARIDGVCPHQKTI